MHAAFNHVHVEHPMNACKRSLLTLAVSFLVCLPTSAQQQPLHTISVAYQDAFLTGGDEGAHLAQFGLERRLHPRWRASLRMGYLRSVARGPIQAIELSWRDRHHSVVDLAGHFDAFRLRIGEMDHRAGLKLAFSYRYRREERAGSLRLPALFASPRAAEELLATCGEPNVYCFEYDDGPGGRDDGPYLLGTYNIREFDPGLLAALEYGIELRQVVVGLEAGYYRYRNQVPRGTHTYYVGANVGYRF